MSHHVALWRAGLLDCPRCYSGAKGRCAYAGHAGSYSRKARKGALMAKFVKARVASGSGEEIDVTCTAGEWAGLFPALVEYLTLTSWGEGQPRQTSTMLLFTEEGQWKICLKDRDQNQVLFVGGKTPAEALKALEAALRTGSADWRAQRPWSGPKSKK